MELRSTNLIIFMDYSSTYLYEFMEWRSINLYEFMDLGSLGDCKKEDLLMLKNQQTPKNTGLKRGLIHQEKAKKN